jgi:hypothetical protein
LFECQQCRGDLARHASPGAVQRHMDQGIDHGPAR